VRIADIQIGERHRKDMGDIEGLARSIDEIGLLHPVVVRPDGTLVAGERRIKACLLLGWQDIPVTVVDLDAIIRGECDENQKRKDWTPTEAVAIAKELEPLEREAARERQGARNDKLPVDFTGGSGAAMDKVADAVGMSRPTLTKAQQIVEAAEENPALFGDLPDMMDQTSIEKAYKEKGRIEREIEARRRREQDPNTPIVYHADALSFLAAMDERSVDLLLTDPPYMTDLPDVAAFAWEWVPVALSRVKRSGRAYIFTGPYPEELAAYLAVLLAQTDFTIGNVLVWTYRNTMGPSPKMAYKNNWQACFYLYGPEAAPLDCVTLEEQFSVQDFGAPHANGYHAWQKPDGLAERLVLHGSAPGDLVADPFVGTGTFVLAAGRLGRVARGADTSPDMLAIAERRGCRRG
jgi:ParB-like chromosome segregation protein Spo0J